MNPPIFEIKDFLSDSECDTLIALAEEEGLAISKILADTEVLDVKVMKGEALRNFTYWDMNNDGTIQMSEVSENG